MTPGCMHSAVRRRSSGGGVVWWSKGDFSFLSMRVCVCLKIMTPKGKQDLCEMYHRELENLWNQVEKKKKKKSRK